MQARPLKYHKYVFEQLIIPKTSLTSLFSLVIEISQTSEYFTVPKESLYRGQDLRVTLRLPVGTKVSIDKSIENIMYDIRNVQDMYDGDMLGYQWEKTPEGLSCTDCATIKYYDANDFEESIEENLEEM